MVSDQFTPGLDVFAAGGGKIGVSYQTFINWSALLTGGGPEAVSGFAGPGGPGAGQAIFAGNGIIASIDNSNQQGVAAGEDTDDGAGVTTGIEFAIPLSVLGHGPGEAIKVAAFINGSNHDYLSNQVLAPLGGSGNLGEPRSLDFAGIPGDQFVIVVESEFSSCVGDFNADGQVNGADFGSLLASWGPCPDCEPDLNDDGTVNGADVGLLLAVWGGCPEG